MAVLFSFFYTIRIALQFFYFTYLGISSLFGIIMKIFPISFSLSIVFLFSSCAHENSSILELHPEERIVNISLWDGYSIGKGVFIDTNTLLTAGHVVSKNQEYMISKEWGKSSNERKIQKILVSTGADMARILLEKSSQEEISSIKRTSVSEINTPIYALVFQSGSWMRIDGKILSENASYIGYDVTLSGRVFTWALETDIVLLPWESGTPVWTLSGELLGVMSAVNKEEKKGWIVQ